MVYNNIQYNKIVELIKKPTYYPLFPYDDKPFSYLKLIIINEFMIKKLLNEKRIVIKEILFKYGLKNEDLISNYILI